MTIYVDPGRYPYRGMIMCHMMTDDNLDELHIFAARLGLKRAWFQAHARHPHYDISQGKRAQAIALGAQPVSSAQMLQKCAIPKDKKDQT